MSEEIKTWPARRLRAEIDRARSVSDNALSSALGEVVRLREICTDIIDLVATDSDIIFDIYSPTEIIGKIDDIAHQYFLPEEQT